MADVPVSEVDITVACKGLLDRDTFSKSDPMCVLSMKDFGRDAYREVGRTEQVKNTLNPEFATKFRVSYYFEEAQRIKFEIYDVDSASTQLSAHDFLGRVELTLGEVVGAPGNTVHRQLAGTGARSAGSIVVTAEEIGANKQVLHMQWRASKVDKKDFLGKSDPFLLFYRINDDKSRTLAFRSEVVKNNLSPTWKPFKLSVGQLCSNDAERPITIECYDYDNDGGCSHDFIGLCQSTLQRLIEPPAKNVYDLINEKKQRKKKSYKNSGQLILMQSRVQVEHSFLDYIAGGTQINFTVAIDFTASNGNPTQPNSLHYIHPYQPNQYMMALRAVGDICQDYDSDKMFPALGFGAKLPNGGVSHEFFINFHPSDPHCAGIDGVLAAYQNAIRVVTLYGPTNFSPVINHVARIAAGAMDGANYFILLILTDGIITDMEQTKAAVVAASSLPMSIIIVGVGNEDFEAMRVLDADDQRLSSAGRFAARDIVQFVPFRDFLQSADTNWAHTQARLAKEVLAEVPGQLTSWMQWRNVAPRPPVKVDVSQLPVQATVAPPAAHALAPAPPPNASAPPPPPPPTYAQSTTPYPPYGQSSAGPVVYPQQANNPYGQPPASGAYGNQFPQY